MARLIVASVVAGALVLGCSSEHTNSGIFGSGASGSGGGAGMALGGAAGVEAGVEAGEDGSDPCGPLMLLSGSVCVDKKPALHADGSQSTAGVSWEEAVTICEARGARLCTEAEREGACPDGQVSLDTPENGVYCGGPAATWEWSSSTACADGRCVSPCCNSVKNPCQCSNPVTSLSFHCCKNLN